MTHKLEKWTNNQTDYPRESSIHKLFQNQALKTPDAIAITYKSEQVKYHELEKKSNHLSNYLHKIGVTKETLVALYLERTPDLIITILAILKAGGAYLPLDTAAPKSRIQKILQDGGVKILITQTAQLGKLQNIVQEINIICLDGNLDLTNIPDDKTPDIKITGNNLAYVMYTSGSTGKPKGVCVLHRGVIRLVKNTNYAYFGRDEVVLQLASIAFDAATFEIWAPLLNGGKLVLMPSQTPSLKEIGETIEKYHVTTLWLTSGLFSLIVEEHIEYLKPLRQLLAGGDVLSIPHVKKVLEYLPNCQLINGYGPTENTTFTCCHKITPNDLLKTSIPIGSPIANTQVYILDENLKLVPLGVAGELYIGGDGLARGYLNQPDLTREKFIQNPFDNDPDSRLYKTGDRARWYSDGTIEFLGRVDFQVKIRGYRVELREIETVLSNHPQIKSTVVLATEEQPNNKKIIAYLTSKSDIRNTELRNYVRENLPDYMVPDEFIFVDKFPININGKIDRKKLIELRKNLNKKNKNLIAPRNSIETYSARLAPLAKIWREILKTDVSIDETFIHLGGNSLQGIQIISRIRDIFGIDLPVEIILNGATIEELATIIETAKSNQKINELNWSKLDLKPMVNNQEFPLSLYQERIWLFNQLLGKNTAYNLPMIWRLQGKVNIAILEQAINQIIQRHESLRTFFPLRDGFPVQSILSEYSLDLSVELFAESEPEEKLTQRLKQEINRPFEISEKPPIRNLLLKLNSENYIFVMVIHHLIADGWSLSIILNELNTLYNNLNNGYTDSLPSVYIQYKDFSVAHRQWLEQPNIYQPLVNYWKHKLENAPPLVSLPTNNPRPQLQTFEGAIELFKIESDLAEALRNLAGETQSTLYMILLGVFLLFLNHYNHQEDLVIGIPIANRNLTEIETTVGCFSNVIPLRVSLVKHWSFIDFLDSIKQTYSETYSHQEFPVEQMLKRLGNSRNFSHTPWFQIIFNFLNIPPHKLEFDGVKTIPLLIEKPSTLFDLMVLSWETDTGIEGLFEYNTNLFNQEIVTQFINYFKSLLEKIVSAPRESLQNIDLLTQEQKKYVSRQITETTYLHKSDSEIHKDYLAPKSIIEIKISEIWQEILQIEKVGVKDNFFELGGNSLLAMRMFARITQQINAKLFLAKFLQNPTIEAIIEQIKAEEMPSKESSLVALQSEGKMPPLFFVNSISYAQQFANYLNKNQPFYALNIFGITEYLTPQIDSLKIEFVASKFIEDMQTVQTQGPYHLLTYCADSYLAFEMAQQLQYKGQKVAFLGFIDAIWEPEEKGLYLYWYNWRQFGLKYLVEKIRANFAGTKERLIINSKDWQVQGYNLQEKALPRHLQDVRLLKVFELARNQYIPRLYSGKINLFLSQEYRILYSSRLEELVTEEVEIHEIPGYHHTLFKEPYVNILAQKVSQQLSK